MTRTDILKFYESYGFEIVKHNYYYEVICHSKIFDKSIGPLCVIEGEECYNEDGYQIKPMDETTGQLQFYYYIEPKRYVTDVWIPTYHFQQWGKKSFSELTERWLRRMTDFVVKKIHLIEDGTIKYPPKKPCWGDLPTTTKIKE